MYTTGNADPVYTFTGKEQDKSGAYYFGARYHDPELGIFLTPDPLMLELDYRKDEVETSSGKVDLLGYFGGGLDWYEYCGQNPVKYLDPDGRTPQPVDDFLKDKDPIVLAEIGPNAYFDYAVLNPFGNQFAKMQEATLPAADLQKWVKLFPWRFNLENIFKKIYSEFIGYGHAFDKHVVKRGEFKEFGITTPAQFSKFIEGIMENPSDYKKLERGRDAFWDDKTGTVVIRDPNHQDKGTAFRPKEGKAYFDALE